MGFQAARSAINIGFNTPNVSVKFTLGYGEDNSIIGFNTPNVSVKFLGFLLGTIIAGIMFQYSKCIG